MHCRMCWFSHLSVSSEATMYLATMVLTTGVHNPQCHTQCGNSLFFDLCLLLCGCYRVNLREEIVKATGKVKVMLRIDTFVKLRERETLFF